MSNLPATLTVEKARAYLAQCKQVDEVKEVRDKAKALSLYLRSRKASVESQADAVEIAKRAERRMGELTAEMPKAPRGRKKRMGGFEYPVVTQKKDQLADEGISKMQASRWEKLAKLSDDDFENHIQTVRKKVIREVETGAVSALSDRVDYDSDTFNTPSKYIEAARELMGGIDLDPATNAAAQKTIKAKVFYTKKDDGLNHKWKGKVWMNPPYSNPLVGQFVNALLDEYEDGEVTEAVCLVNNRTDAAWCQRLMKASIVCFTAGRITFEYKGEEQTATRQGQMFAYLGDRRDEFAEIFSQFGVILEAIDGQDNA